MATASLSYPLRGIWRFSRWDALPVALAGLHAAVLLWLPSAPLIAVGVWWNSNTIAHNFIHKPFFRSNAANAFFSAALSVLLGIPQTLWRDRHLAHHAGVQWRLRVSRRMIWEVALVGALWTAIASTHFRFFTAVYLPAYFGGLGLCWIQGYWEHAAGEATSHYGRLYNFLCLNDGFHAEHHADPARHWSRLAGCLSTDATVSRWPALLRWLETPPLEALERLVLHSGILQRFVLGAHGEAFRAVLVRLPPVGHVGIVGGGLFPRTALILRQLLPEARLTVIDANRRHLEMARRRLQEPGCQIEFRNAHYVPGDGREFDLLVIPLCLEGDREAIYRHPAAPAVAVHDWIWRRRGAGAIVSLFLLKRINLVTR